MIWCTIFSASLDLVGTLPPTFLYSVQRHHQGTLPHPYAGSSLIYLVIEKKPLGGDPLWGGEKEWCPSPLGVLLVCAWHGSVPALSYRGCANLPACEQAWMSIRFPEIT